MWVVSYIHIVVLVSWSTLDSFYQLWILNYELCFPLKIICINGDVFVSTTIIGDKLQVI